MQARVYQGLVRPKRMAWGIPPHLLFIPVLLLAFVMFVPRLAWICLPLAGSFVYLARWASTRDDQLYDVYTKFVKEADAWQPWSTRSARNQRPDGYGKNLPC
jgi:hypothetical protein